MIKAIIFDCFGVLIESPFDVMLNELDIKDSERANKILKIINTPAASKIDVQQSRIQIASLFGMSLNEYSSRLRSGQTKNTVILEYIAELRGDYKIGILSNMARDGVFEFFTKDELDKYFDCVFTSGAIGYSKPNMRAYEIAAEKLGVTVNECIMIDDREDYCEAATNAGMKAVRYTTFMQMKRALESALESQ